MLGDSRASLPNSIFYNEVPFSRTARRRLEALSEDSTDARKSLPADIRILARDVAKAEDVYSESARKLLEKLGRQEAFAERLGRSFVASFRHAEQFLNNTAKSTETQRSIALRLQTC